MAAFAKYPYLSSTRRLGGFEKVAASGHLPGLSNILLSYLSIRELMRVGRVSSFMRTAVQRYTMVAWDANMFLRYWFRDPEGFRGILAQSGAIVTGSQMIQFFERLYPLRSSDLDILTRVGGLLHLTTYLDNEGYVRVHKGSREGRDDDYPLLTEVFGITSSPGFLSGGGKSGIIHVMDFEKDNADLEAAEPFAFPLRVQIVVVAKPPVEHLLGFHSTGVMNFMTHKQAISLFPEATFELRKFYVTGRDPLGDHWNPNWAKKYAERGFYIDRESHRPEIEIGIRSVNDKHSWVISFGDRFTPWMRDAESRSVYLTEPETTSFKFELAWVHEDLKGGSASVNNRKIRLVVNLDFRAVADSRSENTWVEGPAPMYRLFTFANGVTDLRYRDGTVQTQRALTRLLNASVYLPGPAPIITQVCKAIASNDTFYITQHRGAVVAELQAYSRGMFLWMRSADLGIGAHGTVAPFAVSFCLLSGERFRLISLAKMMVDFLKSNSSVQDGHAFDLVSVCYKFAPGGVMGVMFFDSGLRRPFERILENALCGRPGTSMIDNHPVTFWPSDKRVRCSEEAYRSLRQRTRDLYLQPGNQASDRTGVQPLSDITNLTAA